MQYEFLNQFSKRMKHVGRYAILFQNSNGKTTWKQYGFVNNTEQINLIFAVLLYIMEHSLKEDVCTIDDIGAYIDQLNMQYFQKNIGYKECKELGDFIVNVILSNEGKAMYFQGYDFLEKDYESIHISYVANRIVYVDSDLKRTSYYLTDDGYNLLLSTLEIENNMKLTIHEMIFNMHMERQNYDKAVDEIKNIFQLLRIQMQKIQEAMGRIRRNALNYSVSEYQEILDENLETISDTKKKFQSYRELVKARTKDLEDLNFNVKKLDAKEEEKLQNLRVIEQYLTRTIDEHQKILGSHFDLKSLYTHELELLSQMCMIKRFSFRNEFYDQVLEHPEALEGMDLFFRPLFLREPEKIYNLNKAMELQRPIGKKAVKEIDEVMDFGDDEWQKEEEKRQKQKRKKYENCLELLLQEAIKKGSVSLEDMGKIVNEDDILLQKMIPSAEIFKEIMVELIKTREIPIKALKKEKSEFISDTSNGFEVNEMLLEILEEENISEKIDKIYIEPLEDGKVIEFYKVKDEKDREKKIRCSNIQIRIQWEEN